MPRKPINYPELDAIKHLMGKLPDHELAQMAGTTAPTVGRYRRRIGIDGYEGHKFGFREPGAGKSKRSGGRTARSAPAQAAPSGANADGKGAPLRRKSLLDPFLTQLGVVPDAEIAARAGVTAQNVRAFRRRHDIPALWRDGAEAPAASAPAASAPVSAAPRRAASSGGLQGYSVSLQGQSEDFLILSADIASATNAAQAALAKRYPGAQIVAVRHVGPAVS